MLESRSQSSLRWQAQGAKNFFLYLLVFYIALIAYVTLLPFDFHREWSSLSYKLLEARHHPMTGHSGAVSLRDIIGNIVLFMPCGYLLARWLGVRGTGYANLWSVVACVMLSLTIEGLQLLMQSRHTALLDLGSNVFGSVLGIALAEVVKEHGINFVVPLRETFFHLLRRKPFLLLMLCLGLIHLVMVLMPFTFAISRAALQQNFLKLNFIPFYYHPVGKIFFDHPQSHILRPADGITFLSNLLFWIPGAYLFNLCYRVYWRNRFNKYVTAKIIIFFVLPFLYFIITECLQIIVISRIVNINNIISSYLGYLIGILIYALLRPLRRKTYRSDFGLLKIPLILYAIFLAFYSLQPFDWAAFTISEQTLQRERTLPRLVFPGTTQVWDLQDTLGALVAFMPFTLYWTYNWRVRGMDWERIYWRSLLATAAWGLLIEGIQLFSSSRVAALSDIVSYSIGGVLGVLMVHYYALRVEPIHASRSRHIP